MKKFPFSLYCLTTLPTLLIMAVWVCLEYPTIIVIVFMLTIQTALVIISCWKSKYKRIGYKNVSDATN